MRVGRTVCKKRPPHCRGSNREMNNSRTRFCGFFLSWFPLVRGPTVPFISPVVGERLARGPGTAYFVSAATETRGVSPHQIGRAGTVRLTRATPLYGMGGPQLAFLVGVFQYDPPSTQ